MDCLSPHKFGLYSVILSVLASPSYAYQLSGDSPSSDGGTAAPSLNLVISDSVVESTLSRHGNDAETMDYTLKSPAGFSIMSSYSNRLEDPFSMPEDSTLSGFWGVGLKTPRVGNLPAVEVDFSVGGFDGETGGEFEDTKNQRILIETAGKSSYLDYGASYHATGSEYEVVDKKNKIKDSDRNKLTTGAWIGKSFGSFYLSQFIEERQNNVDLASQPDVQDSMVGTSLRYTWSNWPYIGTTFSHSTGTREGLAANKSYSLGLESTKMSLSASHNLWQSDITLSQTRPESQGGKDFGQPESTNLYIGASYYPSKELIISPSFNKGSQNYRSWNAQSETMSSAVSVWYRPTNSRYSFNLYSSLDNFENAAWGMDTNYFYSQAGIQWDLGERNSFQNLVALTVGYSRYEDEIYSSANTDDVSIKLTFKMYSLGSFLRSRTQSRHRNYELTNGLTYSPIFSASSQER